MQIARSLLNLIRGLTCGYIDDSNLNFHSASAANNM